MKSDSHKEVSSHADEIPRWQTSPARLLTAACEPIMHIDEHIVSTMREFLYNPQ